MRRHFLICAVLIATPFADAQEPPRLLPASITGAKYAAPTPLRTASGTQTQCVAPITRFREPGAFPPETVTTLTATKDAADWLWRMNQPDGRFISGLNPVTRTLSPADDFRQAVAALALAEAARFTGDDRLTARATQAVLTLLLLTKPDPADTMCRVPIASQNRVGFAAALALAIGQDPEAGSTMSGQAEELCGFLRKHCQPDGSIQVAAGDDPASVGLTVQAIATWNRMKPEAWKRDALSKAMGFYRASLRAQSNPLLASVLIPGFVDIAAQSNYDRATIAVVFELADSLCDRQILRIDPRNPAWTGGFRLTSEAPTAESAVAITALAHAAKLTRHVPDLVRFQRYRMAAVAGLSFVGNLQYPGGNAPSTDGAFHTRYLAGGVRKSSADEEVRIDAAAHLTRAGLAFLQSGADGRVE